MRLMPFGYGAFCFGHAAHAFWTWGVLFWSCGVSLSVMEFSLFLLISIRHLKGKGWKRMTYLIASASIINKTLDKITCYVIVRGVLLFKGERVVEKAKLLIEELSELTGAEIEFSQEGICELAVEDRLLMLRYRPQDNDWLYFGVVMEREEELSRDDLKKALCLNLFGAETLGLHLGLFGNSLILSGTAAMETLTAEALAEKLLFLSRHIATLSQKFQSAESGPVSAEPAEMPFNANFISV